MNGLPTLHVLSVPLSRMVAPYASGLGRWPGSQDTETFIPDTNLLERLFLEERPRLKIIPNAFGQKAVLKLMFAALIRAAERWRNISGSPSSSGARCTPSAASSTKPTRPTRASRPSPQTMHLKPKYPAVLGLDRN